MESNANIDTTSTIQNNVSPFNQPPTTPARPKKSKGSLVAIICLSILAIAGVACAVYFFLDSNNKSTEISKLQSELQSSQSTTSEETEIIVTETPEIDNATAQNIVDPYLKQIGTFENLLDLELDDNTKVELAYLNLSPRQISTQSPIVDGRLTAIDISYYDLNSEYQYLFGRDSVVAKKDYNSANIDSFVFTTQGLTEIFRVSMAGLGGTGGATFSIVKSASYENNNLVVEVYHDHIPWCETVENEDYCYDFDTRGTVAKLGNGNIGEIIEKFSDRISVYEMIFEKDIDHYVLKDIQKQ